MIFFKLYQRFSTVIIFCVSVPVLSEHIQLVEPSVSIDSRFLTRTFFLLNLYAAIAKLIVSVGIRPSGRLERMIPIPKFKLFINVYFRTIPDKNRTIPIELVIMPIIITKRRISFLKGVIFFFSKDASLAI